MSVVIDVERVNHFRDLIDTLCVVLGEELTTAQSWAFAREAALLEAEASDTSPEPAPASPLPDPSPTSGGCAAPK